MAGLLDFGTEEDKKQSLGLLGLLMGSGILAGNQPGASVGQAFGQGTAQGVQGLMQMKQQQAGQQLRDLQMQKLKADMAKEQGQQSAQAALFGGQDGQGISWNTPRPMDDKQRMAMMGQAFPDQYGKAALTSMFPNSADSPSSVKEWEYFSKLPEEAKKQYLTMKRANPYLDLGGQMVQPNPVAPGEPMGSFPKTPNPGEDPGLRGRQALEAGRGSNQASREDKSATKSTNADNTISMLQGVEDLIDMSTGSMLGTAVDKAKGVFGQETEGAKAIAQLRVIQAGLMTAMPRMEGPQSNLDVQLYREAAGQIADPMVPRETRKAAVKTIRSLQEKYSNSPGASAPQGEAPKVRKYNPNTDTLE